MNVVGRTLENDYAVWTILGTPAFSHTRPFMGEKIYKVHALCEPKVATYPARGVDLMLDEDQILSLGVSP